MKKTLLSTLLASTIGLLSWQTFAANDLQDIYQLATQKDPTVLRSAASRDRAVASIDVSRAALLPSVTGRAGFNRSSQDSFDFDGPNTLSANVTLNQSLFSWSNWGKLDRAEKVALQVQTAYDSEVQNLIVRVTEAYFNVLGASDDLGFAQAEKRSIERQLEQTKQRFAVGLTAITDVHEAQAQFDSAVAREIGAVNKLENMREFLREITGQYHQDLAELNTDKFAPGLPSPEKVQDWVNLAQQDNLVLKSQRVLLDIANQDIDLAKAGHYPTLNLTARLGVNKTSGFDRNDDSSIGINLDVPIYSGGGVQAGVAVAQSNYVEVSQTLELNHRAVIRQVRNSFNGVNAQISSIKALEQAVVSAESALNATEAGFEVGTRTIVDVLLSTRNLFEARRNLSGARYNYIVTMLQLKQAAGSLSEQDLLAINQALTNQ
ncbi:outer membrane channel protein TolC [Rheinheimera sp. MMS21-TC3]|uniref:outer membrane channel protein TolC n=1 Tax=Rheinheimera sp. MMS21-TC3 TaxID=3072790 RepID=UPI0028C3E295|nr:outer membrane channel protein TolC [Rheinheimera sp. MMS21-TC3]WNO60120.1 outer membrane channel protein TolC [Rheinheimera sp. MMS21-TC3]